MEESARADPALRLDAMLTAVELALVATHVVDEIEHAAGLEAIVELRKKVDDLEIALVVALRGRGTTWDEMADYLGVKRQSLHYRLAKKATMSASRHNTLRKRDARYWQSMRKRWAEIIDLLTSRVDALGAIDTNLSTASRSAAVQAD